MGDAPDKPDPTGLLRLAGQAQLARPVPRGQEAPPIAYLGDTVADVMTVQRARQQCPAAAALAQPGRGTHPTCMVREHLEGRADLRAGPAGRRRAADGVAARPA